MIIDDPRKFDRERAWLDAIEHLTEFATLNGTPEVEVERQDQLNSLGLYYHRMRRIKVNVCKSYRPLKNGVFTGSYEDLTVAGILMHEFGHHLEPSFRQRRTETWWDQVHMEPIPTRYSRTNYHEDFAESCRIFILNPDLLRYGRPRRYGVLSEYFRPSVMSPWQEVIKYAPPEIIRNVHLWAEGRVL